MRKQMDAQVNFVMPAWAKEKLWRLCRQRGLLPSQVIREVVLNAIDQMEREFGEEGSKVEASSSDNS